MEKGGWCTREVKKGYGVGLWKEIRREGPLMFKNFVFFVGDGRIMRFWKDKWCGNNSLCDSFPSLYALAYSKDAWVADCRDPWGEEGEWNLWFSRPFNDWEVKAVERFLLTLQGKRVVIDLIGCFGKRLRTRIFLLNPFIVLLNPIVQSRFCGKSFGALGFPLRWAFCLGSFVGGSSNSGSTQKEGVAHSQQMFPLLC